MYLIQFFMIVVGSLGVAFAVLAAVLTFRGQGAYKAMFATSTMTAHEAATEARKGVARLVEVCGTAATAEPLISPVTGTPCVYFRFRVIELQESNFDYTDSDGYRRSDNSGTWRTTKDEGDCIDFLLQDPSGSILVISDGADFTGDENTSQLDHYHKQTEWVVPVGKTLYVLGDAAETPRGPAIQKGPDGTFIVSSKSEKELGRSMVWRGAAWGIAAIVALGAGGIAIIYAVANRATPLQGEAWTAGLLLSLAVALAAIIFAIYSFFPKYKGVVIKGAATGDEFWDPKPVEFPRSHDVPEALDSVPAAPGEDGAAIAPAAGPTAPGEDGGPIAPREVPASPVEAGGAMASAAGPAAPGEDGGPIAPTVVPAAPREEDPAAPGALPLDVLPPGAPPGVIQHDIVIGGQVAFKEGERVYVEAESPDPSRPEYRYVVLSRTLNQKFRLSDLDVFL